MHTIKGNSINSTANSANKYQALWESDLPQDRCISRAVVGDVVIALASSSAVTDVLTSVLPIMVLVNLQISRKRKWGLCFLMGLGLL